MTPPKIYLSPPHMTGNEQHYITEAFTTNWIAPLGPNVDAFEAELAAYVGVRAAAAVNSGTSAIHLALQLLDVGPGDRVFCSTLTFVATANPIRYLGAEPVFIDSEPDTWNLSPQALSRALADAERSGRLPRALLVANLYGQSAKMDEIAALCRRYGVPIIEDAAESLGAMYNGQASGTFGRFGVYSFNGNKIITTSGGGMLVSDDAAAIARARFLATQAKDPAPHYEHSSLGYNYRMSNVLAGIGRAQLEALDERVRARRAIFARYEQALAELPGIGFMPEPANSRATRWLSVITIGEQAGGVTRDGLLAALAAANIEARPVWKPMHAQPLYEGSAYYRHDGRDSVSDRLFRTGLCLPSGSSLTEAEQDRVIACIEQVWRRETVARAGVQSA